MDFKGNKRIFINQNKPESIYKKTEPLPVNFLIEKYNDKNIETKKISLQVKSDDTTVKALNYLFKKRRMDLHVVLKEHN